MLISTCIPIYIHVCNYIYIYIHTSMLCNACFCIQINLFTQAKNLSMLYIPALMPASLIQVPSYKPLGRHRGVCPCSLPSMIVHKKVGQSAENLLLRAGFSVFTGAIMRDLIGNTRGSESGSMRSDRPGLGCFATIVAHRQHGFIRSSYVLKRCARF